MLESLKTLDTRLFPIPERIPFHDPGSDNVDGKQPFFSGFPCISGFYGFYFRAQKTEFLACNSIHYYNDRYQ